MDNRICAQLYNVREFCKTEQGLDESLAKLQKIGYKTVQVSGVSADISAETIKSLTDKYNMEIMLTHTAEAKYVENLPQVIKDHHTMDCKIAGLGAMGADDRSLEGAKRFVERFNKIADILYENGLTFAYHNHDFEFKKDENGVCIMDYILENTDPQKFKFVTDLYWCTVGGVDAVEFLERLGDRAIVGHYKDLKYNADNKNVMCEIGQGILAWDDIIEYNCKSKMVCAAVELDVSERDQFDSFKMSYDFLKLKGFI